MICIGGGVLGWSSDSHKIVARIAAKHIQPKTRRFIRQHLPAKEGSWMGHSEPALVQVSAWADQVLDDPAYAWSRELHFSDTPYRDCGAYDQARDCGRGSGRCIVTAIANYTERAANLSLHRGQRAEALKFLVHLVADAHSGLHVGFAQDAGGNLIHLVEPDMSLHEVWDSLLLDTFRESLGVRSWVGVSSQLAAMISGSTEVFADAKLTREQLAVAGEAIVTETATRVTCASAYSNNGTWIASGDSVADDYLVDRAGIAIDRLIKAGLRLAQVLESVATSYFAQERATDALVAAARVGTLVSNSFSALEFDFDPEAWIFELVPDESTTVDVASDDEALPSAVAAAPPTMAPLPAAKRKTGKQRAKINKRRVEGVDVESLVLIKRGRAFYVTDKRSVESDAWVPSGFSIVTAKFTDSSSPIAFFFDAAVFVHGSVSPALREATLRHLCGLEATPASAVLEPSSVHSLLQGERAEELFRVLDGLSMNPFVSATFDSVADYVRPPVSAKRLKEMYGGTRPSDAQRQVDLLTAEADDIVGFGLGRISLVARVKDLAGHGQQRWVLNTFESVDTSVSLTERNLLFVDTRLLDEWLTPPAGELIRKISERAKNKAKARDIMRRNRPLLSLMLLVNDVLASYMDLRVGRLLAVRVQRLAFINRTGVAPFQTLEFVLRDEAGMRESAKLLGVNPAEYMTAAPRGLDPR